MYLSLELHPCLSPSLTSVISIPSFIISVYCNTPYVCAYEALLFYVAQNAL